MKLYSHLYQHLDARCKGLTGFLLEIWFQQFVHITPDGASCLGYKIVARCILLNKLQITMPGIVAPYIAQFGLYPVSFGQLVSEGQFHPVIQFV